METIKNILLTGALVFGLGASAFATGSFPVNSTQTGVLTYSGTNQTITTTFEPGFTAIPVMQLFGSATNITPFTNTVTLTNFTLNIASNTLAQGVGGNVAWTAFAGTPRIQYGSVSGSLAAATNIVVTFPTPFYTAPNVVYSPVNMAQNTNQLSNISAVTYTNFTISFTGPMTNYWQAIGISALPIQGTAPANGLLPIGN